jgi:hypothetical protein
MGQYKIRNSIYATVMLDLGYKLTGGQVHGRASSEMLRKQI